jgi:hypothetical protein
MSLTKNISGRTVEIFCNSKSYLEHDDLEKFVSFINLVAGFEIFTGNLILHIYYNKLKSIVSVNSDDYRVSFIINHEIQEIVVNKILANLAIEENILKIFPKYSCVFYDIYEL